MAMHMLHVVESAAHEAGSASVLLDGLIEALLGRGIESQMVCADQVSMEPNGILGRSGEESSGADLVHFHGWGGRGMRRWASAARASRIPYVISPHGALSKGPYRRRRWAERIRGVLRDRAIVRGAVALTTGNQAEADDLTRRRVHRRVRLLPYGIDAAAYERNGSPPGGRDEKKEARSVLLLGPIHPVEGLVPLLKSLYELGPFSEGWNVIIAGREIGDWRKMLEAAIARKGASARVQFTDAPDVEHQRACLSEAALLVAPSLHIRCPVSVLQAAAFGVPVVASVWTALVGLEDEIGVFGSTRAELKTLLRAWLQKSDAERTEIAGRARKMVLDRFDWSVLVDRYVRLYEDAV